MIALQKKPPTEKRPTVAPGKQLTSDEERLCFLLLLLAD